MSKVLTVGKAFDDEIIAQCNKWILKYKKFKPLDEEEFRFKQLYDKIMKLPTDERFLCICLILNDFNCQKVGQMFGGINRCTVWVAWQPIKEKLKNAKYEEYDEFRE